MATEKQIVQFNNDAAVIDEFSHAFVNENLKEYLPYDYEILEGLYNKFELNPGDTLINARQPHNQHWRSYHLSVLITYEIDRLASSMFSSTIWIYFIFYCIFVILGSLLTYFITRIILNNTSPSDNILSRFKSKGSITKLLISVFLILGFWLTTLFYDSTGWNLQLLQNDSQVILEIGFLFGFILFGVSGYLLYLLVDYLKETKGKWISNTINWLILIFTIAIALFLVFCKEVDILKGIRNIVKDSYMMLFSDKFSSFIGFERFLAFGIIIIFLVFAVLGILYFLFKILLPRNKEYRVVNVLKYYGMILSLWGALYIVSLETSSNIEAMETQIRKTHEHNLNTMLYKIDAEVYQWYHQQQDIQESTDTTPTKFASYLETKNDIDFSYSWDGAILETKIQYKQDNGETKTINHKLNAETGELDISGETDKKIED